MPNTPKKEWEKKLQSMVDDWITDTRGIRYYSISSVERLISSRDEALVLALEGMKKEEFLDGTREQFVRRGGAVGWNDAIDEAIALIRGSREV